MAVESEPGIPGGNSQDGRDVIVRFIDSLQRNIQSVGVRAEGQPSVEDTLKVYAEHAGQIGDIAAGLYKKDIQGRREFLHALLGIEVDFNSIEAGRAIRAARLED